MEELKNFKRCLSLNVVILLLGCVNLATPKTRDGPLTNEDRKKFVVAHNNFRRDASKEFNGTKQPAAAYMKRMYWNAALEADAVGWSAHNEKGGYLDHGHTGVKNLKETLDMLGIKKPSNFGQNLASGIDDATAVVKAWYGETKDYTLKTNKCADKKACGHYTQVMWANSVYLGCGFEERDGKSAYAACDYFPPGNYIGSSPYKEGDACSHCGTLSKDGFTECDDGLCQPKDKCSPVKECKVVDTENCLCSEADYKTIVERLKKANGLRLVPSSLLLLFSVVVGLIVSPFDSA